MGERVPAGPVVERLMKLRESLTVREICEATGIGFHQLDSFARHNRRKTIAADQAEAIMSLDPGAIPDKVSDMHLFSPEKLKALRLANGYSMRSLEMAAGLVQGQVHHWESGRNRPRMPRLKRVLSVLDCTFEDVSIASVKPVPDPVEAEVPARAKDPGPDDFILAPYPCGVCRKGFRSRHMLAHHQHRKKA